MSRKTASPANRGKKPAARIRPGRIDVEIGERTARRARAYAAHRNQPLAAVVEDALLVRLKGFLPDGRESGAQADAGEPEETAEAA